MKRSTKKKREPGSQQRVVRARLKDAEAQLNVEWLREADEMLDAAGVPKWILPLGETVPSNTVPSRLRWYLARRKDVQSWERDNLDREMELNLQAARDFIPDEPRPNDQAQR